MPKHSSAILELARRGAIVRWNELQSELSDLIKAFPEIRNVQGNAVKTVAQEHAGMTMVSSNGVSRRRVGTRKMSAAARRAVSLRMKKYWAARRKETSL